MLKQIFLFLKGMLFGIANVIPGVSGGTMAVISGVYQKLLDSINNIFKQFKKSILFLLVYLFGAVVAIFAGFKLIDVAMIHIPFATEMLFAGLIIGSIPFLAKPVLKKINIKYILIFLLGFGIVIGMLVLGNTLRPEAKATLTFADYILLFVCGFLASVAMVTPGISGMMMFQIFGYYDNLRGAFLLENLKTNFGGCILILLPVGLGIIVGIFTAAKVISILLKKYPTGMIFVILGFIIGSLGCLFYNEEFKITTATFDALNIILGILFLALGFTASFMLAYINEKKSGSLLLDEGRTSSSEEIKETSNETTEDAQEDSSNKKENDE